MVEQIRISPEEVRGYGNICEEHTLEDFIVSSSGLAKEKEDVHGALTEVYKLVYSVYGLMFDFDKGNKQLYLQTAEADTLSFGFDTVNKQLYLVDENDNGFNLGFDEDTNELYITDDAPPIVHNYSLALDSESYTTSGSLSVSATLLDDGVAVEGATVSFTGGVSTVTATTNSSGVATATVTFNSSGTLTASYSNVSDTATVTVQTYIYQSDMTTDDGYWIASGGNRTITYSSNGCKVVGAANSDGFYKLDESKVTIPSTFYCEFDITEATQGAYSASTQFIVGNVSVMKQSNRLTVSYDDGSSDYTMTFPSYPVHIRVEYGSSSVSVYVNDSLLGTTWSPIYQYIGFKTYSQRSMTVKNVEIGNL